MAGGQYPCMFEAERGCCSEFTTWRQEVKLCLKSCSGLVLNVENFHISMSVLTFCENTALLIAFTLTFIKPVAFAMKARSRIRGIAKEREH